MKSFLGSVKVLSVIGIALLGTSVLFFDTFIKAAEDNTPPEITSFALSPTTFNTETESQTLTLEVTLTDDIAGVCISGDCGSYTGSPTQLLLTPESGDQQIWLHDFTRTSGNKLNGTYTATVVVPKGLRNGVWTASSLLLVDQLGNSKTLNTTQIAAIPGVTGATITNQATQYDNTAPNITAFNLSPTSFNTDNGSVTLTLDVTLTDEMSGVCISGDCGSFHMGSPTQLLLKSSGGQSLIFDTFNRLTGNDTSGTYRATAILPKGSHGGTWTAESFLLVDKIGNQKTVVTSAITDIPGASGINVTNNAKLSDSVAPEVKSFSITPTEFNTETESQTLTLEVTLTDDMSGVCISGDCGSFHMSSPTQLRIKPLIGSQFWDFTDFTRVSGDDKNGTYVSTLTIPANSKEGVWEAFSFLLVDKMGNQRIVVASELSKISGATGVTIVNTASADSVTIEEEWTISSDSGKTTFPEGTVVTRKDGGKFAFYQMIAQSYDVASLPDNNITDDDIVGVLQTGIPGLNLDFDQAVTIGIHVGEKYNNQKLQVQSIEENGSSWANESTCVVVNGFCNFTVTHATYFLASVTADGASNASADDTLPSSWPKTGAR